MTDAPTTRPAARPSLEELEAKALVGEHERHDPAVYVRARNALYQIQVLYPEAKKGVDFDRIRKAVSEDCEANTGVPYDEAARRGQDVIASFMGIMDSDEPKLLALIDAMNRVDDLRLTPDVKKKYADMIHRCIEIQRQCRKDPVKFAVYVGADDDAESASVSGGIAETAGTMMEMAAIHLRMYEIWTDTTNINSLIYAPPGHGKSTNLRYLRAWEIGDNPNLRCLYLTDEKSKAQDTVRAVRSIIKSPRYRAIFPHIRIMGQVEKSEDSQTQFTVVRQNRFARDPTLIAASIDSLVQGRRFERIDGDDFCPPEVREYRSVREKINRDWWSVFSKRIANRKNSRIRIIATPWHTEDTYAQIERAVRDGKLRGWIVGKDEFRIKDDARGLAIPIWDKWGTDFLEQCKATSGRDYEFNYRLNPASKAYSKVSRCHFYNTLTAPSMQKDNDDLLLEGLGKWERWLSIDPAGTSGAQSSDTGCVEIVISPNGYVFVPRCWYWHCPLDEVINNVRDLILQYPGDGYEGVQWEFQGGVKVAESVTRNEMDRLLREAGCQKVPRFVSTGSILLGRVRGKQGRLEACASILSNGLVRFGGQRTKVGPQMERLSTPAPIEGSDIHRLTTSIVEFNDTNSNDGVDALTQWILSNFTRIRKQVEPFRQTAEPQAQAINPLTRSFRSRMKEGVKADAPNDSDLLAVFDTAEAVA